MGNETQKANGRRANDALFAKVFQGRGIDIGAGSDVLNRERIFPKITSCQPFDREQGDAEQILRYFPSESFDFVYSSHCLEHMNDPESTLASWFSLVRPGGYMVFVVPDEDLYEQGSWPSIYNRDHKRTFTINKWDSWSPASINVARLVAENLSNVQILRIALTDDGYDYGRRDEDQSSGRAEVGIEVVLRKLPRGACSLYGRIDLSRLLRDGRINGVNEELAHRLPSTRRCIEALLKTPDVRLMVETGSQSSNLLHSQGMSTVIWAEVATCLNARLYTVDISEAALSQCRALTDAYSNIEYICQDSRLWLDGFCDVIDFLYLDSAAFIAGQEEQARNHQLAEIRAAFPKLRKGSIVLLDDCHVQMWFNRRLDSSDAQGASLYTHKFLIENGAECIIDVPNYQRMYII